MILPPEERRLNDYPILLQNAIRNGEMSEKSSRNHRGPLGIGGQLPSELKSPPPVLSLVFFVGEVIEITFSFRFRMADIQEQVGFVKSLDSAAFYCDGVVFDVFRF